MLIKYNLQITNPIKNELKATDSIYKNSTLKFKRTDKGLVITGNIEEGINTLEASNFFCLGDDYLLSSKNKLLKNTHSNSVDPELVLGLNNTNIKDIPIQLKNKIKTVTPIKDNLYQLDNIIEYKDDVIFYTLNNEGILKIINLSISDYTNLVTYEGLDLLLYFEVSPTLTIKPTSTSNYLFIPNSKLLNLPEGFTTIKNSLVDSSKGLIKIDYYNYLYTEVYERNFKSTYPFLVDGVKTYQLDTEINVQYLLSNTSDNTYLNEIDLDLKDNITAVYLLQKDGSLDPYLLICDEGTRKGLGIDSISSILKIRKQTLTSSIENKKRYVVKQYKVKLKSNDMTLEIRDEAFLAKLTADALQFNKKVIENDN